MSDKNMVVVRPFTYAADGVTVRRAVVGDLPADLPRGYLAGLVAEGYIAPATASRAVPGAPENKANRKAPKNKADAQPVVGIPTADAAA